MRLDSHRKAVIAASAACEKLAEGVSILDVRALSGVTDYFVVATAASYPQLKAVRDEIERALAKSGARVDHVEGLVKSKRASPSKRRRERAREEALAQDQDGLAWVLLDCGSVIVHLMNPPAREFYQLEHLWGDAPRIPFDS